MEYPTHSVMWSEYIYIYIYSEYGIMPAFALLISSRPHYSLSVLLYLSCNKTLSLFYEHVDRSFPSSTTMSYGIPFKDTTQRNQTKTHP